MITVKLFLTYLKMVDIGWRINNFTAISNNMWFFKILPIFRVKDILSYTYNMREKSSINFWIQVDFSLLPSTKVKGEVRISFLTF